MDKWLRQAIAEMRGMEDTDDITARRDWEADHARADEIMAQCVRLYVSEDLADAFEKVGKWYA